MSPGKMPPEAAAALSLVFSENRQKVPRSLSCGTGDD